MAIKIPDYLINDDFFANGNDDDMTAGLSGNAPPYISIEGGKFTRVADGEREDVGEHEKGTGVYIDVCMVQANPNISRLYYEKPYAPGSNVVVPPDCWSDNGVAPSRSCSSPQSATCATCPHAEWGSAISERTGKGIPRCSSAKKVAVLLPGDNEPLLLRIPVGSHKNLRAHLDAIGKQQVGSRMMRASDIITRVFFAETNVLGFRPAAFITPELNAARKQILTEKSAEWLIGVGDQPITDTARVQLAGRQATAGGQAALAQPTQVAPSSQGAPVPPLSQRAMAERAPDPGRRPRGRPKAEAPVPKDRLVTAVEVEAAMDAEVDHEAEEARQAFGVAQNAPEPPSEHEAALNELFGR